MAWDETKTNTSSLTPDEYNAMVSDQKSRIPAVVVTHPDYGAKGDGVTDDTDAIASAISAANGADVVFPKGTYRIKSNLTVPSGTDLVFDAGAKLSIDAGVTVTINGGIKAGVNIIFDGSGTVAGTPEVVFLHNAWFSDMVTNNTSGAPSKAAELKAIATPAVGATIVVAASDSKWKDAVHPNYVCDGVDDQEEIQAAINELSGTEGKIALLEGTYNITQDLTIPDNVHLDFYKGAKLNISSGATVTINGPFDEPPFQIFSGDGDVVWENELLPVYPEWWGAKGDGVTDDLAALQKACDGARTVRLINNYRISGTLYLKNCIIQSQPRFKGGGQITIDGSLGFTGNYGLSSYDGATNWWYPGIDGLQLNLKNIDNSSFIAIYMPNIAETSFIRNLNINCHGTTQTIQSYLYVGYGVVEIDNVNIAYGPANTTCTSYPVQIEGGVVLRNLNATFGPAQKGMFVRALGRVDLSGILLEHHPANVDEPSIQLVGDNPITFRDSSLVANYAGCRGILVDLRNFNDNGRGDVLIQNVNFRMLSDCYFDRPLSILRGPGNYTDYSLDYLGLDQNSPPYTIARFDARSGDLILNARSDLYSGFINRVHSPAFSRSVGSVTAGSSFYIKLPLHLMPYSVVGYRAGAVMIMIVGRAGGAAPLGFGVYHYEQDSVNHYETMDWIVNTGSRWSIAYNATEDALEVTNTGADDVVNVIWYIVPLEAHNVWDSWY